MSSTWSQPCATQGTLVLKLMEYDFYQLHSDIRIHSIWMSRPDSVLEICLSALLRNRWRQEALTTMNKMQCKVKLERRRKAAQAFFTACARGFAEVERGTWRLLYWCSWDAVLINQLYWLALRTMGHHLHQLLTLTWGCPWKRWNVWGILSENARWMGLFSTLQVLAKVWGRNSSQWPCQESTSLCGSAPPDSSTIFHKCGTAFLLWGPGCH